MSVVELPAPLPSGPPPQEAAWRFAEGEAIAGMGTVNAAVARLVAAVRDLLAVEPRPPPGHHPSPNGSPPTPSPGTDQRHAPRPADGGEPRPATPRAMILRSRRTTQETTA